jgi:hypothetical protein
MPAAKGSACTLLKPIYLENWSLHLIIFKRNPFLVVVETPETPETPVRPYKIIFYKEH